MLQNKNHQADFEKREARKIEEQIVKKHLDIIILKALKNGPLSGYAVISLVHREYGVLLGAGMVYNLLHSMEKKNLVRASRNRARYYFLNKEGEKLLDVVCNNRNRIRNIINRIF